jgi:Uma2 family endonuclease
MLGPTHMSSVIGDSSLPTFTPPPFPVRRFTIAEYEEMTRQGILTEDSNVELLQGWIVPKMPKHPPHDGTIDLISYLLSRLLPLGWFVRVQNSVVTSDSIPEPDLAIVRGRPGNYRDLHPTGRDVAVIIEVADSTVQRDRIKAAIYADAGIPWYWIVNLEELQVEIFSEPIGSGDNSRYRTRNVVKGEQPLPVVLDGVAAGELRAREVLE